MTTTETVTGDYTLDVAHSTVGFAARHAMVTKVRGKFGEVTGSGHFDADDPSKSRVEVVIPVKSIDTGNADRDNHLRSNDFLAMDEHPEIRFVSTSVEGAGEAAYKVHGDLSIRGVTKPVTIDFDYTGNATDPFGNHRIGFEGSATINRKDWGVNFNAALEAGGVLVSDKVTLEFDISAIKTA
ncbi:MAG: YceI family protein [Acidimicrobiales bacterium]